jgi:hypothetical protein
MILELLVRHGCHPETVSQFAGDIELGLWKGEDWPPDFTPSPSSIRSVERALRSLERKGLVVRIEKPFKSYERGRPSDGWLLPAEAAEWHARNPRPQGEPPPAETGITKNLSDEELAKIVEKVRSMRGG